MKFPQQAARHGSIDFHVDKDFDPRKNGDIFGIDTETTGLDPWGRMGVDRDVWPCRPFMFTLSDYDGNTACIRWEMNPFNRNVYRHNDTFNWLQDLLADSRITKVFHNYAFDNHMLEVSGFKIRGVCEDTQIRQRIINPAEQRYGLKPLCEKYLGITDEDQKDLQASVVKGRREAKKNGWAYHAEVNADYWLGDPELCETYGVLDAVRTMALYRAQEEAFDETPSLRKVWHRERELMQVVRRMETRGVRIDPERTDEVIQYYKEKQADALKVIVDEAGDLNPKSPKQMTKLFFGELGYTPLAYSEKKKGIYTDCQHCKGEGCDICQDTGKNPKCDGDFLASIGTKRDENDRIVPGECEVAHAILVNSACSNMLNFVESYKETACKENGVLVVHPNFKQDGTKTGRLSATRPNMQNVAGDDSGKKKVDIGYRPRECFIPRDGFGLLIPDFSQIEVWILAISTGSQEFVDLLAQGGDAHQLVADMVYEGAYDKDIAAKAETLPYDKLTPRQRKHLKLKKTIRKQIKCLNFGIIYGQGDALTAAALGCSVDQAKEFKTQYFERFPAVRKFMADTVAKAKRQGHVESLYGRIYPIERSKAYVATNYLIQGAAADLIKNGMIAVDKLQRSKEYRGKLYQLLSIHDELMIECSLDIMNDDTMRAVCAAMSSDWKFLNAPIPFPVGMKVTETRWNENREVEL